MNWEQLVAGLIGVVVGVAVKAVADLWTEGRRRRHDRHMRLLDAAIKASVDFLAAAERTARAAPAVEVASLSLDNSKSQGQEVYEVYKRRLEETQDRFYAAYSEAENAFAAVRMLVPPAGEDARQYLDLCRDADRRDLTKDQRQELRSEVERTVRKVLRVDTAKDG